MAELAAGLGVFGAWWLTGQLLLDQRLDPFYSRRGWVAVSLAVAVLGTLLLLDAAAA